MSHAIRILLVDDYAVVRAGLRALLEGEPDMLVVGEAASAETAVTQASQLQPDIILLDLQLPDYDGLDALRVIRQQQPGSRVIILTNHATAKRARAVLAAGAHGYCLKDNNSRRLLQAIRQVMDGQQVLHPLIVQLLAEGK